MFMGTGEFMPAPEGAIAMRKGDGQGFAPHRQSSFRTRPHPAEAQADRSTQGQQAFCGPFVAPVRSIAMLLPFWPATRISPPHAAAGAGRTTATKCRLIL